MTYKIPTHDDVNDDVKTIFDSIEKKVGFLPNIYAFTANSGNALQNYLTFSQGQEGGVFNAKERETVFLSVSEQNGCEYCLSAHTALAKLNGFSAAESLQLRTGDHPDENYRVLSRLAADIQRTHGQPDEDLLKQFAELGYDEEALVDLVSLVVNVTFTNYLHNIAGFEVDFPKVENLCENGTCVK